MIRSLVIRLCFSFILISISCAPNPAQNTSTSQAVELEAARRLDLMTYNIHGAYVDTSMIAQFIKDQNVDVVCLQEIQRPSPGTDQAMQIANQAGFPFVVSATTLRIPPQEDCDVAIISKYPLASPRADRLSPGGRVYAVSAELEGIYTRPRLYSVHLHATFIPNVKHVVESSTARTREISALLSSVEVDPDAIIAGDFNTFPFTKDYTRITSQWKDFGVGSLREPLTFPSNGPFCRLDYIFSKSACKAEHHQIIVGELSDHLPVRAVLAIK